MQPLEQKSLLATKRPEWLADIRHSEEEYEMDPSLGQRTQHSQPSDASYVENGLHPVQESASDKIVGGPHYQQYKQYSRVPASGGHDIEPVTQKKRICGVGKAVFVLWCILGFLLAVLCVVAGVFGSMIARQDARILELNNIAATRTTPPPDTNATSTTAAPAATTTWVEVANWEYIGCYLDAADRAFPDKYTHIDNQTNRLCAAACADYEYFGTQFGDQCYCSSTPPETAAPAWNCDMHCNGAQTSEICGGYFFLSAWKKKKTTTTT
ncbi:hypothetical protein CTA2_4864 [Colletotrichum tanaceti]|uniref:WSC domain-containing protein n=1 Tax=Colletotrichum tanaceti TaxID=1306861 RepID=A0A4U6XAR7_9PEZI|nr:hypothetical protein CTA2_4864 [Colletotrichum tanaceti]TKW52333.1 hypothetical protein CTA1_7264 [Colletotrichum tanaceti]